MRRIPPVQIYNLLNLCKSVSPQAIDKILHETSQYNRNLMYDYYRLKERTPENLRNKILNDKK